MNTLLVPIDFSEATKSLIKYAVFLSKPFNAELILLHVYRMPLSPEIPAMLTNQKEATREIEALVKKNYGKLLTGVKSRLIVKFSYDFVGVVKSEVKKQKAQLVLIGKSKSSYIEKVIFGNHLTELLGRLKVPVLAVSEGNRIYDIKKISFSVKADLGGNRKLYEFIKNLAMAFDAEINLVHVTPYIRDAHDRKTLHYALEQIKRKLNYSKSGFSIIEDNSPEGGLSKYAAHKSVHLLGIVYRKHSLIEKIFAPNNARNIAITIQKPLLVLPE